MVTANISHAACTLCVSSADRVVIKLLIVKNGLIMKFDNEKSSFGFSKRRRKQDGIEN